MKILMLNHEFPPVGGGAAPVTYELCKHLASIGNDVDVVTMHYGDLPRFERVEGFNVYRTPAIRKRPNICYTYAMATYLPGSLLKTISLAKKQNYDVIHCHFIVPGAPLAWIVSRLRGIPFALTCHGSDVPGYNPDRFGFEHKLILPFWKFLVRRADMLISPSDSLKQLIEEQCSGVEVRKVPNGIYSLGFANGPKERSILMCSRILPRKGFQHVIKAIKDLDLGWEVNVAGEGPYLDELRRIAKGSRTPIKFWGWLDQNSSQLKELYRKSSIFVFPSESENFPTVLLEAMRAGMAIITSTAGGCPEVVGDAGILVEPRDIDGIRDNIIKLIESDQLRESYSKAGLERVVQFSWHNIATKYIECYEELIERKTNG